jgi:hypothetical protein
VTSNVGVAASPPCALQLVRVRKNKAAITAMNPGFEESLRKLPPVRVWLRDDLFETPGEIAPRQEDAPFADGAF